MPRNGLTIIVQVDMILPTLTFQGRKAYDFY